MRRSQLIFLLALIAFSGLGAATRPSSRPSNQPAPDLLLEPIKRAIDAGDLKDIVTIVDLQVENAMKEAKDPAKLDAGQAIRLASYRTFARSFSRLRPMDFDDASKETLKWLLAQKRLFPTLMLAMSEADPPERVLAVLSRLRADQKDKLDEWADLTTAFCVVWDTPAMDDSQERMDPARMVPMFRYYVASNRVLRFDLKTLPWQLGVYVVSNSISDDELAFVHRQYQGRGAIGTTFFDVNYDTNAYFVARPKLIAEVPYTLPNLMRLGGICVDQAYYATHVARSLGVPATACTGIGAAGGVGHAWVGYLKVQGRTALWDFTEGRYSDQLYYRGNVTDPQTRRNISDSDVALLAELQNTTPEGRLQSIALCRLADKAPAESAYDLLVKAITLSAGNRDAWLAMAELGAKKKLSDDEFGRVLTVIQKFAAERYPDFALAMARRMSAGLPERQQLDILEKLRPVFRARPDILARLRVEQGDILRGMNRPRDAMSAYMDVLNNSLWAGPVVVETLERADKLLRSLDQTRLLPPIYKQVYERMPKPQPSAFVPSTPFWTVGRRYAALLREGGDNASAQIVDAQMSGMVLGGAPNR